MTRSKPQEISVTVPQELSGKRLDKVLSILLPDVSRTRIQSLIEQKAVFIKDTPMTTPSLKISAGVMLTVFIPEAEEALPRAEKIALDIVYEDDDLLVINKQAGLVVHPGAGNADGTLVNALLHHCGDSLSGIGGVKRPGIVHRLDKETGGLMVAAKNDFTHQGLSAQLADRSLSRTYHALCWGIFMPIKGEVDAPIGRHKSNRQKMAVGGEAAREAKTYYHVIESYGQALSLVECKLESGRTHQIRVHMQHIKHPLVGDPVYGAPANFGAALLQKSGFAGGLAENILQFPRQALHAKEIAFIHPRTEEEMTFETDYPADMLNLLKLLK